GEPAFVHESSYVDEPCEIGEGTPIWQFCHVMKNAIIGRDCTIGQKVVISPRGRIGDGGKIQNNVSGYEGVVLEKHSFFGPSMVFANVVNPRSEIVRKSEFKTTRVGRGASLGANSTMLYGLTIGRYAFVGAGCGGDAGRVRLCARGRQPARRTGWMC